MSTVFVCHRGHDALQAEQLAAELKSTGHDVWLDQWRIDIGDSIVGRMNEGLEEAAYLVPYARTPPASATHIPHTT